MAFGSDEQRSAAIMRLLEMVNLRRLWASTGPTEEAIKLRKAGGGYLSSGERRMLLAVWVVWTGGGGEDDVPLGEVMDMPPAQLQAFWTLLQAANSGAAAVDAWLTLGPCAWLDQAHCESDPCDGAPLLDEKDATDRRASAVRIPRGLVRRSAHPFCACTCARCVAARAAEDALDAERDQEQRSEMPSARRSN